MRALGLVFFIKNRVQALDLSAFLWKISFWAIPTLFAITLHEVAHGWMARFFGDRTAEMLGRLSLNPLRHLDPEVAVRSRQPEDAGEEQSEDCHQEPADDLDGGSPGMDCVPDPARGDPEQDEHRPEAENEKDGSHQQPAASPLPSRRVGQIQTGDAAGVGEVCRNERQRAGRDERDQPGGEGRDQCENAGHC